MKTRLYDHITLLVYFFIAVCFMDTIFRYTTIKNFSLTDAIISFLFIGTIVIILYFIVTFFEQTAQLVLSCVLLGFIAFIYVTQMIYYQFFRTFYSMYSVGNGGQVFEFWKDIVHFVLKYAFWILLLLLPVIILAIFGKSYFSFQKTNWWQKGMLFMIWILIFFSAIGAIHLGDRDQHSAYHLYYHDNFPLASVERLGLLTMMRLDVQRQITGWTPVLEKPPFVQEPVFPENDDEDQRGINNNEDLDREDEQNETDDEPIMEPEYNVLEIDFDALIDEETDENLRDMHEYFKNIEPTAKNEYTGLYEGYNVIFVVAEAFDSFAIHKDITPTLYKMYHEGYRFENFYTPIWEVSTSDGEYVALNSLIPKSGVWSFQQSSDNYLPFVLGNQLKSLGYTTNAYHNHTYTYYGRDTSHPNMGYDYKAVGNGLVVEKTWPASDLEMMEKSVSEYIHKEPFHTYYLTISGHMQYSFTGNYIAWKNRHLVEDLNMSDQAKAYLATQIELDRALEYLLDALEEAGVADRTLVAVTSDHFPYGLEDETINEFVGHPVEQNFELYENTFLLYTKNMEPETITKPASSLDILPTLSNLLGLEYDSRLMMGRDIFSDSAPLVVFLNRSFMTDQGMYHSETEQFIPFDGPVSEEYIEYMKATVQAKFYYSAKILETNYYRKVMDP